MRRYHQRRDEHCDHGVGDGEHAQLEQLTAFPCGRWLLMLKAVNVEIERRVNTNETTPRARNGRRHSGGARPYNINWRSNETQIDP